MTYTLAPKGHHAWLRLHASSLRDLADLYAAASLGGFKVHSLSLCQRSVLNA
jgi:hypothetical protein